MKIAFKWNDQIEVVDNVSVDDKCFPLVAGIHPYSVSSVDPSPLAREAALWFKTLAIETIYIDCNKRLIYWLPVLNDVDPEIVSLRKSASADSEPGAFIPSNAKALFEDSSHYEFDASLKDMMGKCTEIIKSYIKRKVSTEDFNKKVAHILHVYILKSVIFSEEHLYSLNRAKSLIEERLKKSEENIVQVADNIDKLNNCLAALMSSLIQQENLESEQYLRTCDREFLRVFLNKTEGELERKNLTLEAEQSKVNWAKSNAEDGRKIEELQEIRDKLFRNIEKLIKVREAIKNVITRKEKRRRKVKFSVVVPNCFHNIFVEINRRISIETLALDCLCNDKVNISAAREATVCAILELCAANRDSNRETKFDPEDCVDFLTSGSEVEKPDMWLTFQERVSRVLENTASEPYRIHKQGCEALRDQINLALSEYALAVNPNFKSTIWGGSFVPGHHPPTSETTDTAKYDRLNMSKRSISKQVTTDLEASVDVSEVEVDLIKNTGLYSSSKVQQGLDAFEVMGDLDASVVHQSLGTSPEDQQNLDAISEAQQDLDASSEVQRRKNGNAILSNAHRTVSVHETTMSFLSDSLTVQYALKSLMKQVDNIKGAMQALFCDVVETLSKHLCQDSVGSSPEQLELIWKSYERSFCQEMLNELNKLYYTGLQVGIHSAYQALLKEPFHEILKGDKILDLFFGPKSDNMVGSAAVSVASVAADNISCAKSVSLISLDIRHCAIDDLYNLANSDSYSLSQQIHLEGQDDNDEDIVTDSTSSGSSELSNETESSPKSTDTKPDSGIQDENEVLTPEEVGAATQGLSENWTSLCNPGTVAEILDPVLSPFRRYAKKCLDATCFLDKVRYITKAIEDLNRDVSRLYGPSHQSACDDIITMLVLALSNMSEDVFVGLYIDLRLLMDILPPFLSGTLYDYNLVSLFAAYDFLFSRNVCNSVIRKYPGSFKRKSNRGHLA